MVKVTSINTVQAKPYVTTEAEASPPYFNTGFYSLGLHWGAKNGTVINYDTALQCWDFGFENKSADCHTLLRLN